MKFRKVNSTKYIGENGYSLIQCANGRYTICKNDISTAWGSEFTTVRAAENFLLSHDYIKATVDNLPINKEDMQGIAEMYGLRAVTVNSKTTYKPYNNIFAITLDKDFSDSGEIALKVIDCNKTEFYTDASTLVQRLDEIVGEDIFAHVIYRGVEFRDIFAAKSHKTAREITKNLIRVRSSNVWAYGIEIHDDDNKVGDVYVQFKGKNGGPGDVYEYFDVSIDVWRKILSSTSKGHSVWKYLRFNYWYRKLTGDKKGKLPNAVN